MGKSRRNPLCPSVPPSEAIGVLDFFSGCGGTSAGLHAAGLQILAGIDCDPAASATYRLNFPNSDFLEVDIRTAETTALDDAARRTPAGLVISACAPCQPYSTMRRGGRSTSPDRSLLLTLIPFIERLQPDAILVENVPGMQKIPGASTWNRFRRALHRMGYSMTWEVVDCRTYGVPQRRRRLVLLASRHGPIALPEPTHGPGRLPYSTIREWIEDLPPLEAGDIDPNDTNHRAAGLGDLNMRRIKALKEGGSRSDWPDELWLDCHRKNQGHEDVYGRMKFDSYAPVLTTKCTDITNGRFGHPVQNRAISVREAASIQTFPRSFSFTGGIRSSTRQVGNAVPVLLAQRLGEHIIQHLRSVESESL